jgi:hypothetical protein
MERRWELTLAVWSQTAALLAEGWEPFAVVPDVPPNHVTQAVVYFRRWVARAR